MEGCYPCLKVILKTQYSHIFWPTSDTHLETAFSFAGATAAFSSGSSSVSTRAGDVSPMSLRSESESSTYFALAEKKEEKKKLYSSN